RITPVTRQGENDAMTPESIQAMIDRAIQRNSTHTQKDASQNSGHDDAYAMTWETFTKRLTDKYCPKGTSKYWGILILLMIGLRLIPLGEFNTDFHPMVDFIAASPLRRNLKLKDEDGIVSILDTELFENLTLMGQYSRRERIAQSSALPTVVDEPVSPVRDVSEGEACPTES
nr:hypothetical protein [Tanacetum cinerariifolium]